MDGKLSITIMADKPVKIRLTLAGNSTMGKEITVLKKLFNEIKEGNSNVASKRETRASGKN